MSLRNNKRFLFELSYKRSGEGVTGRLPFDRLTREDSPPGRSASSRTLAGCTMSPGDRARSHKGGFSPLFDGGKSPLFSFLFLFYFLVAFGKRLYNFFGLLCLSWCYHAYLHCQSDHEAAGTVLAGWYGNYQPQARHVHLEAKVPTNH